MPDLSAVRNVILTQGWLSEMPPAFQQAVLARSYLRAVEPGEVIQHVDDPPAGMFGLVSGAVVFFIAPSERGPSIAHFARPGFWFGEGCVIDGKNRRVGVTATRRSELLALPLPAIREIVAVDPSAWRPLAALSQIHFDLAVGAYDDLLIRDHVLRLVAVLLRLGGYRSGAPPGGVPDEIDVTQEELASLANVSRTTARTVLRDLESKGYLNLAYRQIRIRAVRELRVMLSES